MRVFGLIGYPLGHSFSQKYFSQKFSREKINDTVFENFQLESIEQFPKLIEGYPNLHGLSVTIPYKESIINYLDELSEEAEIIGAVNAIKVSSGKLKGFNTDYIGFLRSLIPLLEPQHQKALILGTGGASKAIQFGLEKLEINYQFVSRAPGENKISYTDLTEEIIDQCKLIINTTPLGMYPEVDTAPDIPYAQLTEQHLLYDLTYNPEETLFIRRGKEQDARCKNGYEMLVLQAEEAWRIWCSF